MARWYIVSYRHPGHESSNMWREYGEPIPAQSFHSVIRFLETLPPFTEVRVKILDVRNDEA